VLASPIAPGALLAGKVLGVAVLSSVGFAVVWLVTTAVFGAAWGPPATVVVLIVATVLSISGVSAFVCGLARTNEQADTYTSAVTFVLALLGATSSGPPTPRRCCTPVATHAQRLGLRASPLPRDARTHQVLPAIVVSRGGRGVRRVGGAGRQGVGQDERTMSKLRLPRVHRVVLRRLAHDRRALFFMLVCPWVDRVWVPLAPGPA